MGRGLTDDHAEEYNDARQWCKMLASHAAYRDTAEVLMATIQRRVQNEGFKGMAVLGGLVGGVALLSLALSRALRK